MRYIHEMKEGDRLGGVYLCKQKSSAVTKNGKHYENVILQDRTGQLDCKIWDPNSEGIAEFDALDYVYVVGSVSAFNGALQASLRQVRRADESEYVPADYVPITDKNRKAMYMELMSIRDTVKNEYLRALLDSFFGDKAFAKSFYEHSAAKSIHHSFVGGLLEHTLAVTKLCVYLAKNYPAVRYDLLITSAILHDAGKVKVSAKALLPKPEGYTEEKKKFAKNARSRTGNAKQEAAGNVERRVFKKKSTPEE